MRPKTRRLLSFSGCLTLSACNGSLNELIDELPSWQGDFVTYHASHGLETCEGTRDYVDGFVNFVADELQIDPAVGVRYLWLDDEDFSRTNCEQTADGCSIKTNAVGRKPGLLHEVVHAVTHGNSMNRWPFFTEGIAVAYDPWTGDGMGIRYVIAPNPDEPLLDPRPLMTSGSPDPVHYGLAGSFVAFLLSRHGPQPFVAMTQRLGSVRTMNRLRKVFRQEYGHELDAEVELFMSGAPCDEQAFPVLVYDCTMPNVAWSNPTYWAYGDSLDCTQGPLVGGIGPDRAWPSIRSVTLDVPAAGRYQLAVGSDEVDVQLGACFGCPWEPRHYTAEVGKSTVLDLDPGRYYVRMRANSDEAPIVVVGLSLAPVP